MGWTPLVPNENWVAKIEICSHSLVSMGIDMGCAVNNYTLQTKDRHLELAAATGKVTHATNVPHRSIQEGMRDPKQYSPSQMN